MTALGRARFHDIPDAYNDNRFRKEVLAAISVMSAGAVVVGYVVTAWLPQTPQDFRGKPRTSPSMEAGITPAGRDSD
jgi:hypothetical protein